MFQFAASQLRSTEHARAAPSNVSFWHTINESVGLVLLVALVCLQLDLLSRNLLPLSRPLPHVLASVHSKQRQSVGRFVISNWNSNEFK